MLKWRIHKVSTCVHVCSYIGLKIFFNKIEVSTIFIFLEHLSIPLMDVLLLNLTFKILRSEQFLRYPWIPLYRDLRWFWKAVCDLEFTAVIRCIKYPGKLPNLLVKFYEKSLKFFRWDLHVQCYHLTSSREQYSDSDCSAKGVVRNTD